MNFLRVKVRENRCRRYMSWRRLTQKIRGVQDPNLRTLRVDPIHIPIVRLVMHQQIRLQGFNQTGDLSTRQSRMDSCARELKRASLTYSDNVRIPAVGLA